jgi:glycine/D-amino acid oxidase-like deaminating enzyme
MRAATSQAEGPTVDPIETDRELPRRADVIVIGGGIVGMCTALSLSRAGVSVVVCEKGRIAGEQSSRNWGWCRAGIRDPREIPLANEAIRMWTGINACVQGETGYRTAGSLFVCETDSEIAGYEDWLKHARAHGMTSRMINSNQSAALLPGATRRFKAALHTPTDGCAEPQKAVSAIAQAARRLGAVVVTNCAVRGLDIAAGRVGGVVTERGCIAASSVVLAAGAWSRLFTIPLGLRLPLLKIQGSVLRTEPLAGGPEGMAWVGGFAFRKRFDGGYTIAKGDTNLVSIVPDTFRFLFDFLPALKADWPLLRVRLDGKFKEEWQYWRPTALDKPSQFERVRVLSPEPVQSVNAEALRQITRLFPVFSQAKVAEQWAGMIDVTPDAIPVISPIDELPGFYIAAGFSGHGFGVGPAAGKLTADLVLGRPPSVEPLPFRYSRLVDGSKAKPGGLASHA